MIMSECDLKKAIPAATNAEIKAIVTDGMHKRGLSKAKMTAHLCR
jgi:hypothetical protein